MVVLQVVQPHRAAVLDDRAVPRHAVGNTREQLRQVDGGVGVVPDPEQQHLAVQLVDATDGTLGYVGWQGHWVLRDPLRLWAGRCEGLRVVASQHAWEPPEGVRGDTQVRRGGRSLGVERFVIIARRRHHHQCAGWTDGGPQRLDQSGRSALDRPYGAE